MDPEEYSKHDAVALAALVREGGTDPEELLAAARARNRAVNGRINAVVRELDPPAAGTGEDAPFAGVPFLVKDLHQDIAGQVTSNGSAAFADHRATETSDVVQRWLDAGLRIFGQTNTPEFGAKGITESTHLGPARNPWDTDHTPGGSSGGTGAAVAAGVVPCAGASDGGGSIRIPASACGLFGLKVSRGLIPSGPAKSEPMVGSATDGVISRSVRDTAALLDVMVGPTSASPYLPALPGPLADEVGQDPGRLRIGVSTESAIRDPHPEAVAAARAAADLLSDLGHDVVELATPPFDAAELAQDFLATWFAYLAYQVDEAKRVTGAGDDAFEADTLVTAALGRAGGAIAYIRGVERRHEHVRRLAAFHDTHDLLLTPSTATPPPRVGDFDLAPPLALVQKALITARAASVLRFTPIVDQVINDNLGWVPYTQLANLTGRPAVSVPLHWTPEGLPIGTQLVGPLGSDGLLLRVSAQLEQARPWADRRPPI